jgi:hypothetical protein
MQEDPMPGDRPGDELVSLDRDDAIWQGRVLSLLLAGTEDGQQLSRDELTRELIGETPEWAKRDAVERALNELERHGLARRVDALVLPTRAARHIYGLEVE